MRIKKLAVSILAVTLLLSAAATVQPGSVGANVVTYASASESGGTVTVNTTDADNIGGTAEIALDDGPIANGSTVASEKLVYVNVTIPTVAGKTYRAYAEVLQNGIKTSENEVGKNGMVAGWKMLANTNFVVNVSFKQAFAITVPEETANGTVSISKVTKFSPAGDRVVINAIPDEGYEAVVSVKDANGSAVSVNNENGSYSFTMPAANVTISAAFTAKTAQSEKFDIIVGDKNNVKIEPESAADGEKVTVTFLSVSEDMVIEKLYLIPYDNDPAKPFIAVDPVEGVDNKFEFTMPGYAVRINPILNDKKYDVICGEGIMAVAAAEFVNGQGVANESDTKIETASGNMVMVKVKEVEGKVIDKVTAVKVGDSAESITAELSSASDATVYRFRMPKYAVTVSATYKDPEPRPDPIDLITITARLSGNIEELPITDGTGEDAGKKIITIPADTPNDAIVDVDVGIQINKAFKFITGEPTSEDEVSIFSSNKLGNISLNNGKYIETFDLSNELKEFSLTHTTINKAENQIKLKNCLTVKFVIVPKEEKPGNWNWNWSGGGVSGSGSTSTPSESTPETSDTSSDNTSTSAEPVEFTPAELIVDEAFDEETAQIVNDMRIEAPEGTFTEGTQLNVKPDPAVTAANAFALDITFMLDGTAVQPANNATVTVSFPVPPMFRNVAENLLMVFHFDNGTYTRVNDVTVANGVISFNTTHFSTYVVSTEDLAAASAPESTPSDTDAADANPYTGTAAAAALPAVALTAGTALVIFKKKK